MTPTPALLTKFQTQVSHSHRHSPIPWIERKVAAAVKSTSATADASIQNRDREG